jgi:NADH:ubiquinone oxidoreductase subunit 2 (subunit N)
VVDFVGILPAVIVAIAGVAILLLSRVWKTGQFDVIFCWLALLATGATLFWGKLESASAPGARPVASAVTRDPLSRGTTEMALALGAACAALTAIGSQPRRAVRHAVVLLSLAGVLLACVANDFVLVVVAVPLSALSVCAGQFWEAETAEERTAALISLGLNALAALCLVGGALLLSGLAGTTNLSEMHALPAHTIAASGHLLRGTRVLPLTAEIGTVLLLAGLGIPLLAAPFQLAAAEIFEGATAWGLALTAALPRCAVVVAMIRVFVGGMPACLSTAQTALTAAALVTVLIGGSLAYWQSSQRRLLALVVMVQAGLILIALASACSEQSRPDAVRWIDLQTLGGSGAALLLFGADSVALLGLMAIVSALERSAGRVDDLEEFTRLLAGNRVTAAAAGLLLLSLAGVPPLPGFWARVAVLRSVLSVSFPSENDFLPHQNTGYVLFSLLLVAASLAVAAPCLSVAGRLLLAQPAPDAERASRLIPSTAPSGSGSRLGLAIAALLLAFGIFPNVGLRWAARVTFQKRADAVLAAEKAQPVKKHRRPPTAEAD